jgi:hypothetical protein
MRRTIMYNGVSIIFRISSVIKRYVIVLAYLESQCTKFHAAGWTFWFLTSFYLESCIWPDKILIWTRQRNSILRRLSGNVRRLRPELWRQKELAVASQRIVSHFLFHQGIFYPKQHDCNPPPTVLSCFPDWRWNWKATILILLRWSRHNRRRCWTPSQNTTSRMRFKTAEELGTVLARRRGLLRGFG